MEETIQQINEELALFKKSGQICVVCDFFITDNEYLIYCDSCGRSMCDNCHYEMCTECSTKIVCANCIYVSEVSKCHVCIGDDEIDYEKELIKIQAELQKYKDKLLFCEKCSSFFEKDFVESCRRCKKTMCMHCIDYCTRCQGYYCEEFMATFYRDGCGDYCKYCDRRGPYSLGAFIDYYPNNL